MSCKWALAPGAAVLALPAPNSCLFSSGTDLQDLLLTKLWDDAVLRLAGTKFAVVCTTWRPKTLLGPPRRVMPPLTQLLITPVQALTLLRASANAASSPAGLQGPEQEHRKSPAHCEASSL